MKRLCIVLMIVVLSQSSAHADHLFSFSPESGGTRTRVTLTMPTPTVALSNRVGISDNTLPFDFVTPVVDGVQFPNPGNFA